MSDLITADELAGIRADANLLMGVSEDGVDVGRTVVTITRETGKGTLNTTTARYTPTVATLYTGAAIVFPIVYRRERQEALPGSQVRTKMYRVLIPWDAQGDAGDFRENDKVIITACDDVDFIGRDIRITDVMFESDQAFRRLSGVDWFPEDAVAY